MSRIAHPSVSSEFEPDLPLVSGIKTVKKSCRTLEPAMIDGRSMLEGRIVARAIPKRNGGNWPFLRHASLQEAGRPTSTCLPTIGQVVLKPVMKKCNSNMD